MNSRTSFPKLTLALLLISASEVTAAGYYVQDYANVQTEAGTAFAVDGRSYVSPKLVQPTLSNSTLASVAGLAGNGQFFTAYQLGQARANDKAEIGALHSFVSATSDTGFSNPPVPIFNTGTATGSAQNEVYWSDTISFHTANPNGSDFYFSIALDDNIFAGGHWYPTETGYFAGSAQMLLTITQDNLGLANPFLSISDQTIIRSDGTITYTPPDSRVATLVFHDDSNLFGFATLTGKLSTSASAKNGSGQTTVNASNTGLFAFYSPDPLASYSTASGTVFLTSVPEPTTLSLLALSAIALTARRRKPIAG
jgi:hypothetical protein